MPSTEADRVKKLTKPSPPAWLVNQVYWRSRSVYRRLIETGAALRRVELDVLAGGGPRQSPSQGRGGSGENGSTPQAARDARDRLQRAAEVHRKAVADAVHQALRHAATSGLRPQPDALARSLEALSLSATPPDPPGRLTDVIAPAGLEALSGVLVAATVRTDTTTPPLRAALVQPDQAQAADRRRQDEQRAAFARATTQLAAARDAEQAALAQVERAERSVRTAETALETVRRELAATQAAARDAVQARQNAEQALALAKATMHP